LNIFIKVDFRTPPGFDRTRNVEIGNKNYKLEYLDEAFTSEHWIVRIFKVKEPQNRVPNKELLRQIRRKKPMHSKKGKKRQGIMNNKPVIVKGKTASIASVKTN
jgi:dolichyl-diphosphooligosaccharide---protein glycosyltransferase